MIMNNASLRLVLGNPLQFLSYRQALDTLSSSLDHGPRLNVVTPYATFWRYAETDKGFREAWHAADVALPDGIAVLWAKRMLEYGLHRNDFVRFVQVVVYALFNFLLILLGRLEEEGECERVSGADLVPDLLDYAERNGKSVYVLGGWAEALDDFGVYMQTKFPILRYVIDEQVAAVDVRTEEGMTVLEQAVDRIRTFRPDLLIVSLGPPLQEKWSHKHFGSLSAKIVINAGATVDYLSGKNTRAPKMLRRIGLEWAWRMVTQPKRVKRILFAFPYFPLKVMAFLIKGPQSGNSTV